MGSDPFDGIHMHDVTGAIMGGGDLVSVLQAMDNDATFSEDAVTIGDSAKLVIPRGMSMRQAITSLFSYWYNQQQPTTFVHTFRYRPHDGALAAHRVLHRTYGFVDGKPTESFFGSTPPKMITVRTGVHSTEQVPWGELRVSALADAVITFEDGEDETLGTVFHMTVTAPRRLKETIEMLFATIEMELQENSIYRGKIIKVVGDAEPVFVDLSDFDPSKVIYSPEVERMLAANLWQPMRQTELFRQRGLSLRQGVLGFGHFGTGKSLAGLVTALIASQNGWTAILADGDDLTEVMELGGMYGPAFLFIEDVDKVASADAEDIEQRLEDVDGIVAKGREILMFGTTNYPGMLHAGMLRPGRFDVHVEFATLPSASVERLIRAHVSQGLLDPKLDFDAVSEAMTGYTPAFVAQAIARAQKYAMLDAVNPKDPGLMRTQHFLDAASELRPQIERMANAGTKPSRPTLDVAFGDVITRTVHDKMGEFRVDTGARGGTGRLVHDPSSNGATHS